MSLDKNVYLKRLEAVRSRLSALGADGLFATPSSNLFYLTGISFSRSERLTALLLFKDREPFVLCPAFEADRLRGMSAVPQVHTWEETEDPFRLAPSLFPGAGGVLAVEPSTAFDDVERLLAAQKGWKPVSAAPLFMTLRMIKTSEEIAAIRRAIAVALPRFEKAFGALRPGSVEADVSHLFGGVLEAQSAAIEKAAPGVPCSEVDGAARRVIEKAGHGEYFTHRLGHGLGIDVHEPPYMVAHNRTVLEPGMTFTSEPGIYLPGRFGVRIEDDVLVTERGAESLSPRVERLESIEAD